MCVNNQYDFKWSVLDSNTWNHLDVCKEMSSIYSFRNKFILLNFWVESWRAIFCVLFFRLSSSSSFFLVVTLRFLAAISSSFLQVYLSIWVCKMIQPGKSFSKFDWWSNKAFKKYEDVIQILTSLFFKSVNPRSFTSSFGGGPRGVMAKAMDCGIVVSEFVLQSRYYVHFRANTLGKGMRSLILPAMGWIVTLLFF